MPDEAAARSHDASPSPMRARWRDVNAVLDRALDAPPADRPAIVERACDGDPALRAEVERMLAACDRTTAARDFMAEPASTYAEPLLANLSRAAARAAAALPQALASALADRYLVEREIARGGMATIFLAEDLRRRQQVAIKVIRLEAARGTGVRRFHHEIEIVSALEHPHIVPVLDSGDADGLLYYVMPFVSGPSLRDRLRRGALPVEEATRIVGDVASALEFAHRRGVVHRDIKPENILLGADGALLTDFGIARPIVRSEAEALTTRGVVLGTAAYMSPEQIAAAPDIDGRSDVYSLGCVLYEMLVGQPPFTGPDSASIAKQQRVRPAPPIATVRPELPQHVARAVARALEKRPASRFATARKFADAVAGKAARRWFF